MQKASQTLMRAQIPRDVVKRKTPLQQVWWAWKSAVPTATSSQVSDAARPGYHTLQVPKLRSIAVSRAPQDRAEDQALRGERLARGLTLSNIAGWELDCDTWGLLSSPESVRRQGPPSFFEADSSLAYISFNVYTSGWRKPYFPI